MSGITDLKDEIDAGAQFIGGGEPRGLPPFHDVQKDEARSRAGTPDLDVREIGLNMREVSLDAFVKSECPENESEDGHVQNTLRLDYQPVYLRGIPFKYPDLQKLEIDFRHSMGQVDFSFVRNLRNLDEIILHLGHNIDLSYSHLIGFYSSLAHDQACPKFIISKSCADGVIKRDIFYITREQATPKVKRRVGIHSNNGEAIVALKIQTQMLGPEMLENILICLDFVNALSIANSEGLEELDLKSLQVQANHVKFIRVMNTLGLENQDYSS